MDCSMPKRHLILLHAIISSLPSHPNRKTEGIYNQAREKDTEEGLGNSPENINQSQLVTNADSQSTIVPPVNSNTEDSTRLTKE